VKVPATPPDDFVFELEHIREYQGPLWRVFRTEGPHALEWDQLRHYGPIPDMRFDPQPPPPGEHVENGVMYTATHSYTALGEVYQEDRVIDRAAGGATIASWIPSRVLKLLDLTTNWPVLNGAAASMMMDDKKTTRAWAAAIFDQLGDHIDGLYHQSSINNQPLVTLFSGTEVNSAFPARVNFSALLSDTLADELVKRAKKRLGYTSL
jgi:hypothetical protein